MSRLKPLIETWLQDLRVGCRMLLRAPAFSIPAILILALGMGANTAIFSVLKAVVLQPLPYEHPEELVEVTRYWIKLGSEGIWNAYPDIADLRRENRSFSRMICYHYSNLSLREDGPAEALFGLSVSSDLFPELGIQPAFGRLFTPEEAFAGHNHVILLSDDLWRRRFSSDPGILQRKIRLSDESYEVVGVMKPGFNFPLKLTLSMRLPSEQMQYWIPLATEPTWESRGLDNKFRRGMPVIARLKPGVSLQQAQTDLDRLTAELARRYPKTNSQFTFRLTALQDHLVGNVRRNLLLLLGAMALVLFLACANIANLLLARAAARRKEMAVRKALGAGAPRLVRQSLTESAIVAFLGVATGFVFAWFGLHLGLNLAPPNIPRIGQAYLDGGVLSFTLILGMGAAVLFGLAPAWQCSGVNPHEALLEGSSRATSGKAAIRLRKGLLVSEIAAALVVTLTAILMLKSFVHLLREDPGFTADHRLASILILDQSRHPTLELDHTFFHSLEERMKGVPGVVSVASSSALPFGEYTGTYVELQDRPSTDASGRAIVLWNAITPSYLQLMQIPLAKGRNFTSQDTAASAKVVLVNETAERRFWPGENAIGKHVHISLQPQDPVVWREVVGVVGDVRQKSFEDSIRPEIYAPLDQTDARGAFVILHTAVPPLSLDKALRREVAAMDPDQAVFFSGDLQQYLDDSLAQRRFTVFLIVAFGLLALLLACIGIYAVFSYSVSQRTGEFGIRMAVGATPAHIGRVVFREATILCLAGIAIGITATFGLSPLLSSLLYGISPTDPGVFFSVPLGLLAVALLAIYLPMRRAMKVEPMYALRHE